jgi:hypothetical protein
LRASRVMLGLGLLIALTAAALLLLGVIESGVAAMIGIIGIGLIASSGGVNRRKID